MNIRNIQSIAAAACAGIAFGIAVPAAAHGTGETVTPNFRHAIPNLPGKTLTAVVVDYAPGAASPAHRHAGSAFIYAYVLSGDIESQVDDGPTRVYHTGESFFEAPGAVHRVSRNASTSRPARLLAVFVADSDDTVLTTPVK
ncbi:cupin domain-containing protein [Burkholderia multivorans]|jgi:quercetin dioxygenase-like cupin family protein|uniref:Cupin domain-containing protein n=2 Tax=Burkholderia multivorans TaxID=87883 RepID=A0A8E2RST8_9BURK|nr:cupin domain-containing protein [Burkholderia multivorans]EEE09872.1 cupin 2, conserved barrel domain protein [Burkholderia multivorans CGD2]EEE15794.1 cupin 2, conserved barrel domain protein [Burkholderia multivorans CGD2M]EKS9912257.1 cupin domain-containing protein [Burkholderia multivorans]KOE23270.1 cupin [Burkholderia multivorans R-20526]MBU9182483.1 cupin domain-containing protein [Burkholderia multivorans]